MTDLTRTAVDPLGRTCRATWDSTRADQAQRAILPVGPLLAQLPENGGPSPLAPMNTEERLWADYRGTGLTVGKHPMAHRAEMNALGECRRCTWRVSRMAARCASQAA